MRLSPSPGIGWLDTRMIVSGVEIERKVKPFSLCLVNQWAQSHGLVLRPDKAHVCGCVI